MAKKEKIKWYKKPITMASLILGYAIFLSVMMIFEVPEPKNVHVIHIMFAFFAASEIVMLLTSINNKLEKNNDSEDK